AAKGWKDGDIIVAPFTASVQYAAKCIDVCADTLLANVNEKCSDSGTCHSLSHDKKLKCASDTAALNVNGKVSRHEVKCTRKGWIKVHNAATIKTLVDFKTVTKLQDTIKVECVELCAASLIDPQDMQKKFSADKKISCGTDKTVALYVDGKPTRDEVQCTRGGWI
ncbi:hypothetical protein PMAYCL1PPCAC_19440, partial [Pristionchus mayeri]